ncbi:MAG TPA: hypothetical protein VHY08_20755, partial [Bacillota bacterium]|nr:hypothetical protein [Bacillota bacterium]
NEIQLIEPKVILVLGKEALKFFIKYFELQLTKNITELHNVEGYQIIKCGRYKIIHLIHPSNPTYHIDYYCYQKHFREVFGFMLKYLNVNGGTLNE